MLYMGEEGEEAGEGGEEAGEGGGGDEGLGNRGHRDDREPHRMLLKLHASVGKLVPELWKIRNAFLGMTDTKCTERRPTFHLSIDSVNFPVEPDEPLCADWDMWRAMECDRTRHGGGSQQP